MGDLKWKRRQTDRQTKHRNCKFLKQGHWLNMKQNSEEGGGSKIAYNLYIIYGCTLMLGTTCVFPGSWATAWPVCLEKGLKNPCPMRKSKVIQLP